MDFPSRITTGLLQGVVKTAVKGLFNFISSPQGMLIIGSAVFAAIARVHERYRRPSVILNNQPNTDTSRELAHPPIDHTAQASTPAQGVGTAPRTTETHPAASAETSTDTRQTNTQPSQEIITAPQRADTPAPSRRTTSPAQTPSYCLGFIWSVLRETAAPIVRTATVGAHFSEYSHACNMIVGTRFAGPERAIALSTTVLLSSTLAFYDFKQFVGMMHSESHLIQGTLTTFMRQLGDTDNPSGDYLRIALRWLAADHPSSAFSARLVHLVVLMLLSPLNRSIASLSASMRDNPSQRNQILGLLRGMTSTLVPAFRYLNVIAQTSDHLSGEATQALSWRDFTHVAVSCITYRMVGDSPMLQRTLSQALSRSTQRTAILPEHLMTPELQAFLRRQESVFSRACVWTAHAVTVGSQEAIMYKLGDIKTLPETFKDCFTFINLMLPDRAGSVTKYMISYLLCRLFEARMPVKKAKETFVSLSEAAAIRPLLVAAMRQLPAVSHTSSQGIADFFALEADRPTYCYFLDVFVVMALVEIKTKLAQLIREKSFKQLSSVFEWVMFYYAITSDYLRTLSSDLTALYATGDLPHFIQNHAVYHIRNLTRAFRVTHAIGTQVVNEIKQIEQEPVQQGESTSTEAGGGDSADADERPEQPIPEQEVGAEKQAVSTEEHLAPIVPTAQEQAVPNTDEEERDRIMSDMLGIPVEHFRRPDWIAAGEQCTLYPPPKWLRPMPFGSSYEMDWLRQELIALQAFTNRYFLDDLVFSDYFTGWEVLEATNPLKSHYEKKTRTTKIFGIIPQTETMENVVIQGTPELSGEKRKYFVKNNPLRYHGLAVRHKSLGVSVILTAGTNVKDIKNLKAAKQVATAGKSSLFIKGGMLFTGIVSKKHFRGNPPHIFTGHSLGCSFNMWINAITGGICHILNIDAYSGIKLIPAGRNMRTMHHSYWEEIRPSQCPPEHNIESVVARASCLNHRALEHVGERIRLPTSSHDIKDIQRHYGRLFRQKYPDTEARKAPQAEHRPEVGLGIIC